MNKFHQYHFSFDELFNSSKLICELLETRYPPGADLSYKEVIDQLWEKLIINKQITGCYKIFPVEELNSEKGYLKIPNRRLNINRRIATTLNNSTFIAVFACSAGELFTKLSAIHHIQSNYLELFFTDLIGSWTVEKAMDVIQKNMTEHMNKYNLSTSNRFSPGYCGWEVTDQRNLFDILSPYQTGITLTQSFMMLPLKSISGIIGIGENIRQEDYACDQCVLKKCNYPGIRKLKPK